MTCTAQLAVFDVGISDRCYAHGMLHRFHFDALIRPDQFVGIGQTEHACCAVHKVGIKSVVIGLTGPLFRGRNVVANPTGNALAREVAILVIVECAVRNLFVLFGGCQGGVQQRVVNFEIVWIQPFFRLRMRIQRQLFLTHSAVA